MESHLYLIPAFLTSVALTLIARKYAFLIYKFLHMFSTIFHELGHGLTAILLGSRLTGFKLYLKGGGLATHASSFNNKKRSIRQAMIALAGYISPFVVSSIMMYLALNGLHKENALVLMVIAGFMFIMARNLFAFILLAFFFWISLLSYSFNNEIFYLTFISVLSGVVLAGGFYGLRQVANIKDNPKDLTQPMDDFKSVILMYGGSRKFWASVSIFWIMILSVAMPLAVHEVLQLLDGLLDGVFPLLDASVENLDLVPNIY